jgi:hypothetical protein
MTDRCQSNVGYEDAPRTASVALEKRHEHAMFVLRKIASRPVGTTEQRLAEECVWFLDLIAGEPEQGKGSECDGGAQSTGSRDQLAEVSRELADAVRNAQALAPCPMYAEAIAHYDQLQTRKYQSERSASWGYTVSTKVRPGYDTVLNGAATPGLRRGSSETALPIEPAGPDFDALWPAIVFDEPYVRKSSPLFDARVYALRKSLGRVFADMDGRSLGEIVEAAKLGRGQEPAETELRLVLRSDLLTLCGPADLLTLSELRAYFDAAIEGAGAGWLT